MISAPLPDGEEKRLQQLHELDILDTLSEQAYDDLTRLAAQICRVPIALVSLIDEDRQWFKSRQGLDAPQTSRDVAFCAHTILDDQTMIVEDTGRDERFHDNPLVTGDPDIAFYAGTPLVINDQKIGTLCVIDRKPRKLSTEEVSALEALGRQVESQLQLRLRVKELERLDRTKDEFIAMVSHEMRTPLASVHSALSRLTRGKAGTLSMDAQRMTDIAFRNAKRLLTIINDILDLAQLQAGRFEIRQQEINLVDVVCDSIDLHQSYCEQCGCKLRVQAPATIVWVYGDRERLLQVLGNLISNAAKFSGDGETIDVELTVHGDKARVAVRDQGPGIPPEHHAVIFQKFRQASSSGHERLPGTGLGLNIAQQIVGLHGGEVGLESTVGQGALFYIELPLLVPEDSQ